MSDKNDFDFDDFDNFDDFLESEPDQDDILDNFDTDDNAPSEAEIIAKLDAYEKSTKRYSRMALKGKSKSQRVEAIRWLGESGNPQAIKALVRIYRKDKTPGMKEEAAYALGQFQAYLNDQADPATMELADERVNAIILEDKFGKRANPMPFILGEVVLVALAVVLFIFGGILAQQNAAQRAADLSATQTAMPTPTPDTEQALQADIENFYTGLFTDTNFYKQQLAAATRGEGVNCNLDGLSNPNNYTLSEQWQDNQIFVDTIAALNNANDLLSPVVSAYQQACANGVAPAREDALDLGGTIIEVERELVTIRDSLAFAGITIEDIELPTQTPPPAATLDPNVPTPTEDLTAIDDAVTNLRLIIDNMTGLRGPAATAQFNWQQVVDNGELYLSGCNQPRDTIPDNVTLDQSVAGQSPLLDSAVSNVNIALDSTRLALDAFYAACDAGEVPEDALGRQAQANLAMSAFDSASTDLNILQGR
ncbi:MAG: HEAT repeat domain-containing protein [Chloroflexota bacterium]